jgi:tetratricopeptide (TPR) repeat protein
MIYDFSNRPVPNFSITLGEKYSIDTDINGRFTLAKIPVGAYTLVARKEGYETYHDKIDIKDQGQIIYIRIPSQIELLDLADLSLTSGNLDAAEGYVKRAYNIDPKNTEMLFYYATVMFKKKEYDEAIFFLQSAQILGSKDEYITRFLSVLKELKEKGKTHE